MQKILLILCAILTTTSVHATQMCARRDTTVIPLDSIAEGIFGQQGDATEWMWLTPFAYGTVHGVATCLSKADIAEIQGVDLKITDSMSQSELNTIGENVVLANPLVTSEDSVMGRSGYSHDKTQGVADELYARFHCYCKLTHPMSSSGWVLEGSVAVTSCTSLCAGRCAYAAKSNVGLRTGMFKTIGIGYEDIDDAEYTESVDLTSYN